MAKTTTLVLDAEMAAVLAVYLAEVTSTDHVADLSIEIAEANDTTTYHLDYTYERLLGALNSPGKHVITRKQIDAEATKRKQIDDGADAE